MGWSTLYIVCTSQMHCVNIITSHPYRVCSLVTDTCTHVWAILMCVYILMFKYMYINCHSLVTDTCTRVWGVLPHCNEVYFLIVPEYPVMYKVIIVLFSHTPLIVEISQLFL